MVTLTRIRGGLPARKDTINKLLIVLSDVYKLDLSTENVTGIVLEERQQVTEKQPASSPAKTAKPVAEKPQKRAYKPRKADLPEGCILASKFAELHGVPRPYIHSSYVGRTWCGDGPR